MNENIRVAVRVKPLLSNETPASSVSLNVNPSQKTIEYVLQGKKSNSWKFGFNMVADQDCSQENFFDSLKVSKMVDRVLKGFNATIFAYGPTGSGKTYTMQGDLNKKGGISLDENMGIIPRTLLHMFKTIENQSEAKQEPDLQYSVSVSYVQLYNEKIYDLLKKESFLEHKLRWSPNDEFVIQGAKNIEIQTPEEALKVYEEGAQKIIYSSHKLNAKSSRSHAVFKLEVQCTNSKGIRVFRSNLTLVDLAGSEKPTQISDLYKTQEESININKSLFYLRKVITCLSDGKPQSHVPYRNSKLTCLLKSSVGGNSSCLMIGCIRQTQENIEDNLATLKYAGKAQSILNRVVQNHDPSYGVISRLRSQKKQLEKELENANRHIEMLDSLLKSGGQKKSNFESGNGNSNSNHQEVREEHIQLESERKDQQFFESVQSKINTIKLSNGPFEQHQENLEKHHQSLASRFLETMNLVKELLNGNQDLRSQITDLTQKIGDSESEIQSILLENQDLYEKVNQLEQRLVPIRPKRLKTLPHQLYRKRKSGVESIKPIRKNKTVYLRGIKTLHSPLGNLDIGYSELPRQTMDYEEETKRSQSLEKYAKVDHKLGQKSYKKSKSRKKERLNPMPDSMAMGSLLLDKYEKKLKEQRRQKSHEGSIRRGRRGSKHN